MKRPSKIARVARGLYALVGGMILAAPAVAYEMIGIPPPSEVDFKDLYALSSQAGVLAEGPNSQNPPSIVQWPFAFWVADSPQAALAVAYMRDFNWYGLGTVTLSGGARAQTDFGSHKVSASLSTESPGVPIRALSSQARSVFTDTLTMHIPTGGAGVLRVAYDVNLGWNDSSTSSGPVASYQFWVTFADLPVITKAAVFTGGQDPVINYTTQSSPLQVTDGQALPFVSLLDASVLLNLGDSGNEGWELGSAQVDAWNSVILRGLWLTDTSGDPIPGAWIEAASGTFYPVPEPSSFALSALGFAALFWGARTRRR